MADPDHAACPGPDGFCHPQAGCATIDDGVPDWCPVAPSRIVDDPDLHVPVVEREVLLLLPDGVEATPRAAKDAAAGLFDGHRTAVVGFVPEIGLAQVWVEVADQAELASRVAAVQDGPYAGRLRQHTAGLIAPALVPDAGTDTDYGWDATAGTSAVAWHLTAVDAPGAWSITTGDASLGIGVLEVEGTDFTHADLADNVGGCFPGGCDAGFLGMPDSALVGGLPLLGGLARLAHGTHVTGILAAVGNNRLPEGIENATGVMWRASLHLGRSGVTLQGAAAGFAGLARAGVRVVNMSLAYNWIRSRNEDGSVSEWEGLLGGPPAITDPVALVLSEQHRIVWTRLLEAMPGVLVVQAAGNHGDLGVEARFGLLAATLGDEAPGRRVLTVAALGKDGLVTEFSGPGGDAFAAPGGGRGGPDEEIPSLGPAGTANRSHGTSMAAPVVAGAAGLMLSINPGLTPEQVHDMILASAPVVGETYRGETYRRLDARAAVAAARDCLEHPYDPVTRSCPGGTCLPECAGRDCGDDGCGGACGTCDAGSSCQAGKCVPDGCEPACAGKECGDDGCGGTCGKCGTGQNCEVGKCKAIVTCTDDCSGTVDVPAGPFWMGCNPASGPGCPDPAETPYHEVSLSAFRIDRFEVTNARLVEFLNSPASDVCGGRSRSDCVAVSTGTSPVYYDEPPASGPLSFHVKPGRENHPAQVVKWLGAVAFCQFWAKGHVCSEAQWERAARGTDGRTYPWGNGEPSCDLVVVKGEGGFGCPGVAGPVHVGSAPAGQSPCGALDMAGNAAEWVYDYYDAGYYESGPKQDPVQSEDVEGAGMGVLRGGSWAGYNLEALWKPFMTFTRAWSKQTNPAGFRCCYEVAP